MIGCGGGDNDNVQTPPKVEAPKLTQITITVEQTINGQPAKSESKTLSQGERFNYTFSVAEGHMLSLSEESSCKGELEGNDYIIKEVKQNCSVKVLSNPKAISISLASDENSTIELTKASYFYGEKVEITVVAKDGYMIEKVSGCGVKKQHGKSYIIEKLKSDCKISTSTLPTEKQFSAEQLPNIEVTILSEDTAILDSSRGLLTVDDEQLPPVPEKLNFEHGILALDLKVPEGKSAKVQLTYETQLPADFTYQKLIGEQWQALDTELVKVSDDRFSLELSLTDGGAGDADGVVNGVIKDPGAPASLKYYQVSAPSNAGGTVSPNTQSVAHGTKGLIEITPSVGFELAAISGCDGELTGLTYTTAAITSDCAVSATFQLKSFLITASSGDGGSITPEQQNITYGTQAEFTVTADEGQTLQAIQGCNGSLNGHVYTTGVITELCSILASFEPQVFLITTQVSEGGSIAPLSKQLAYLEQTSFTLTPSEGYSLAAVRGCEGSLVGDVFTTGAVTENCQVQANFELNTYTVTATASEGGSVTPATQRVNHGSNAQISLTANEGYSLSSVTGCNGTLNGNVYTTGTVTANCQVQANFELNTYTVTATASEGGSVTPATQSVSHGSTGQLTVSESEGYNLTSVTGCNGTLNENIYTTAALTESCQVQAEFEYKTDGNWVLGIEFVDTNFSICVREHVNIQQVLRLEDLTSLSCNEKSITMVNELQFMTGLTSLELITNQLTTINLNANLALTRADLRGNAFDQATLDYLATISWISDLNYNTTQVKNGTGKLNDSGITWCVYDDLVFQDCLTQGYDGQDGKFGRDAQSMVGTLQKIGGGNGGFDFTKLDVNGDPLPYSATNWSCVKDNHTGLTWEVKTYDVGLHDTDDRYNWFNPDSSTNGGNPGYKDDDGNICYGYDANNEASYCNTHAFIARVNAKELCGFNDWRMPNREELRSIVDYGNTLPAIDSSYFPRIRVSNHTWYWSSSVFIETDSAYSIDFNFGNETTSLKSNDAPVRLVRAGQ